MMAGNLLMAHILMALFVATCCAEAYAAHYRGAVLKRAQRWRRAKLRERAWGLIELQRELQIATKISAWQHAYKRHREAVGVVLAIEGGLV